jgi:uncharacterized protein YbbC (DUF1343 family)
MILHLLQTVIRDYPDHFAWRQPWSDTAAPPIDLLYGSDTLRVHLDAGLPLSDLIDSWQPALREFLRFRRRYMLYSV